MPSVPLELRSQDIDVYTGPLWRIHQTTGAHPAQWNSLRRFGPLVSFRWEPHPFPRSEHAAAAVGYTAQDYITAFGEVFQDRRRIRLSDRRTLSGWYPSRPLELLNLAPPSQWALNNGASASLPYASKNICRGWAQSIYRELGDRLDGLRAPSTITGAPMIVLFNRAAEAFPEAPEFSRALDHSDVVILAVQAAQQLNWPIL